MHFGKNLKWAKFWDVTWRAAAGDEQLWRGRYEGENSKEGARGGSPAHPRCVLVLGEDGEAAKATNSCGGADGRRRRR